MTPPPSSNRAETILIAALDHAPEDREAFLAAACGEDTALLAEVRALLAAHEAMPAGFLAEPAVKDIAASDLEATIKHDPSLLPPQREAAECEGERIGRYKLLQEIGQGGFGTVWMAEQMEPVTRRVALKIIKLGMDTREVIARFEQERQALAMMDHPNIAKVLDAGATDKGRPFFVMELVKGLPITKYCDEAGLGTRERLALFGDVCSAIQHAHQKGVIHRDIKPSNVMVTLHGDRPVVKVIDFGIAKATQGKLTDMTICTRIEQFIGTPVYMSPEQASLSGQDIDTRSDIYALGILLYELLVGKPPFDGKSLLSAGYDEMRRIIREVEPPKPSSRLSTVTAEERSTLAKTRQIAPEKLSRLVEPDLDWIVMKAIEKDRTRRYETANAFAQDVARFLADEPVSATPPSTGYRFRKWVRRNKVAFAAGSAIATSLVIGLSVSTWLFFKERTAHREAVSAGARADAEGKRFQRQLYIAHMNLAKQAWDNADVGRVLELLSLQRPQKGAPDLRSFEWYYLEGLCRSDLLTFKGHTREVHGVAFSPDGNWLASASGDPMVKVWDAKSGREALNLEGSIYGAWSITFSADGKRLASGTADGMVKVWDATSGRETLTLHGHSSVVNSVAFSPDGRWLASTGDTTVKVWDAATGQEVLILKEGMQPFMSVAFSHDGKWLAAASTQGVIKMWDAMSGQEILVLHAQGPVWSMAFSPDGKRLATAAADGTLEVWDTKEGEEMLAIKGHFSRSGTAAVLSVAFSPDGTRLASAGTDGAVKLWDATSGQEILTIKGHTGWAISSLAFSLDGARLASGSSDHTVKVWDVKNEQKTLTLKGHTGGVRSLAFSLDGKRLVSGGGQEAKVWDTTNGRETLAFEGHNVTFSPDGRRLAAATPEGTVKVWDATSGQEMLTFIGRTMPSEKVTVSSMVFSPDGARLASAGGEIRKQARIRVWDVANGRELLTLNGHAAEVGSMAFSPDGKRLVSAATDGTLKVWDVMNGEEMLTLQGLPGGVHRVAFSADGRRLASTGDMTVKLWDARTGQEMLTLRGHTGEVMSVAFSPDGSRLASGSQDKTVKVWDTMNGQETLTLRGHTDGVWSLAFSPDGKQLASGSQDKTVKVWGAWSGQESNGSRTSKTSAEFWKEYDEEKVATSAIRKPEKSGQAYRRAERGL